MSCAILFAFYGCTGSSNPAAAAYRPPAAAATAVPGLADWREIDSPVETKGVFSHALIKAAGKTALIGGKGPAGYLKSALLTSDFEKWSVSDTAPGFGEREDFAYCADRGKTYIIGGYYTDGKTEKYYDDTWESYGAVTFTAVQAEKKPAPVRGLRAAVFKDSIRLSGGFDGKNYINDVYRFDGKKGWLQEDREKKKFEARAGHGFIVHDGKLWVIGGKGRGGKFADVWSSSNGVDWEIITANAMFGPRSDFACFNFGGRMWVIGGELQDKKTAGDVWWSVNGSSWVQAAKDAFPSRSYPGYILLNDSVYIFGGVSEEIKNDGWWSK